MNKCRFLILTLFTTLSLVGCFPSDDVNSMSAVLAKKNQELEIAKVRLEAEARLEEEKIAAVGDKEWVTFVRIIDGNTIVVRTKTGEEIIKLLNIDAPPRGKHGGVEYPYGEAAADYIYKTLSNDGEFMHDMWLERTYPKRNSKGMTLGYIWYGDAKKGPLNLNISMVLHGYARYIPRTSGSIKYVSDFEEASRIAKEYKKNIWKYDGYVTDRGYKEQ